ncbi:MAG: ribose-5-phosphate isomerase RpiA [Anaerolineales bacterium]|nr:MAG: ribose-5-phosphate isomerase RpiA [Anaerolineales bacterium]
MEIEQLKRIAAEKAVEFIESGMVVGLGHGSTAVLAVRRLGALLSDGVLEDIVGVPCSLEIEAEAQALGIPLTTLDQHPIIDVTIDGADEVDPRLDLIKGGGGALLREKIVAQATRRQIIAVDEPKLSPALGTHFALPVEVVPFAIGTELLCLKSLGAGAEVRRNKNGSPFVTDAGNLIVDCRFGPIDDPQGLSARLDARAGIMGHGLFLGLATDVLVGTTEGVRHLTRESLT